jgi:outer membrane receptor protein involved in Fe transport
MKKSLLAVVATLALLGSLGTVRAFGQAVYGSIIGTVTDPSGAAVPNAKVTVTSQTKNTSVETTTNESGNYSVTHLIPDVYSVRAEGQGFKALEFKDIPVSADTGVRVDGQFQVGGSSETVEVTSEAPQLKTDRADVAVEFTSKQLAELPIYNRNFQSLELLSPGTQVLGWGHAATENPQGSKQIFVNGQHFSGTGYELDGTDNQDPILGIIIVNPSLDAVTETKITTQNYDAEFGKALAGIMTAQTKSGTNEFHGSTYFYDLDPVTPARNPFTGKASPNNWKQYGGAVGGPIIKNKLFFFFNYEGTRRKSGTTFLTSVPTNLVRSTCLTPGSLTCDLSEFLNNVPSGNGQVYNPYDPKGTRTLYPGNVIPQSVLQAQDKNFTGGLTTAEKIIAGLPAPNASGDHNGTLNNYSASGSGSFNDYQYVIRGDYRVSDKLQTFGRYTHSNFKLSGKPVFGALGGPGLGFLGLAGQSLINNYSVAAGFDYTLSSTLLTDFRFGYFRYNPHSTKFDQNSTNAASALGLPGLNTSDITTNGLPGFYFDAVDAGNGGFTKLGEALDIGRCNCPLIEKEQGYQYVNNWTKISGNHQFKFGGDLRHATNLRVPSDANRTGQMHFNWKGTSDGNGNGGIDLATYLFSEVTSMERYVGSAGEPNAIETQNRYFFYGQDTWRATHKLTINYGLRWEHYTPEFVNGKGNGGFAVLPEGVIRVAGYGGISNNGSTRTNWKLFAPRIGIAYELTPKTVVRMGYGRSFDIGVFGSLFGHTVTQNLPVLARQTLTSLTFDNKTAAYNFTGTCLPAASGYDPTVCGPAPSAAAFPIIPSNGILPLFGICPESTVLAGNPCTGNVQPKVRPDKLVVPTVDAWNVTVQRQLTSKTSLELAYVANHGSHVFKGNGPSYNLNQATIVGCVSYGCSPSTGSLSFAQRSPLNNAYSTPYTYADGKTANVVCCGGQGFDYRGNDGTNSYRSLQVRLEQRATAGLTLQAFYTYSRAYDNDGNYQPDLRQGYGRQDFNRDSVFILTSIYELPFGRGKRFMGNASRAADLLLGGWQWNTTMVVGSGLPFSPSYQNCGFDRDTGPCRPNKIAGFHMGSGGFDNQKKQVVYFTPGVTMCDNPNQNADGSFVCHAPGDPLTQLLVTQSGAFSDPGLAHFGKIQRNSFTGPGEFLSDMSIFKNFTVTERVHMQLQLEFFNVFNHPVYANPNGCIDCKDGGLITGLEANSLMRQIQLGARITF